MQKIQALPYYTLEEVERYLGINEDQILRVAVNTDIDLSVEFIDGHDAVYADADEFLVKLCRESDEYGEYQSGLSRFSLELIFPFKNVRVEGVWHIHKKDVKSIFNADGTRPLSLRLKPTEEIKGREAIFEAINNWGLRLTKLPEEWNFVLTRGNLAKLERYASSGTGCTETAASDEPMLEKSTVASIDKTLKALCAYRSLKAKGRNPSAKNLQDETERLFHGRVGKDVCLRVAKAVNEVLADFKDSGKDSGLLF